MQDLVKKWGKHIAAIVVFLVLTMIYFAPSVFEGKVLRTVDTTNAMGMGESQLKEFEKTAKPGEFSEWSDAMFSGMPYVTHYGSAAPNLPGYEVIEKPLKAIGYWDAGMVFVGLVCFYLLMCILGVNWWLALAGSIAFAFASYNIILIDAGHVTKAYVIGYMPIVLAGMALLFKQNYIWGTVLFLLGVALSIGNSHIQITYYLVILCLFIYIGYLIWKIKQKAFKELGIVTAIMAVCVIVSILPNARNMYVQWDLSKSSTRGPTELTTTTGEGEKISSGLDKEYAFQWSYGVRELLTVLIPNAYGGPSYGVLDKSSEMYKVAKAQGLQIGNDVVGPTYWGDKPFTSGPVYFGAVICFLFVLGMFVIPNKMKWWLFAGALFLTFMALGRNMDFLNDLLFHYLPMYNKFRTPETALVIPGLIFPIIGIWGLKVILEEKIEIARLKKAMIWSLALTGGICLIVWLFPTAFLSFQSAYDTRYASTQWYSTLIEYRASIASSDAFRSMIFIILSAGLVFLFIKAKNKKKVTMIVCAGIAVLTLVDLWQVDKRYVNDGKFHPGTLTDVFKPSAADEEIFKDTDPSFRVAGLRETFQETTVSYFHHSIGGYYAAKLRRYQELIDHRLSEELNMIIRSFNEAQYMEDIQKVMLNTPSLNMLNTRYIIYSPDQAPIRNPFAFGNAWFVQELMMVDNADAEIEALNNINPLKTAIVDKRFASEVNGFTPQPDSLATITLDSYRPNHLVYSSKASTEQLAVFSEIYYDPGWIVRIDGQPASHFRADWTLRAMRVPAGEHTIEFEFRPQAYIVAANVGVFSSFFILLLLIGAIGYSVWNEWKKRKIED